MFNSQRVQDCKHAQKQAHEQAHKEAQEKARLMQELFGDEPDDVDMEDAPDLAVQDHKNGEPSSETSHQRTAITDSSTTSVSRSTVAAAFLQVYPALMDPRHVLQLITMYRHTDTLAWANKGRKPSILTKSQLTALSQAASGVIIQRLDGGEATLKKLLGFAREHHRLHCFATMGKGVRTRAGAFLTVSNLDEWYKCISAKTPSDISSLPLYYSSRRLGSQAFNALRKNEPPPTVSSTLRELMYDPLFPYRSLLEISDQELLEYCVSHSYDHISDKIKVNEPTSQLNSCDVRDRVKQVLRGPEAAAPIESPIREAIKADAYFKRCANCIDADHKGCRTPLVKGIQSPRQPGQQCTRCKGLGEKCADMLKPVKSTARARPQAVQSNVPAKARAYLGRQLSGGHHREGHQEVRIHDASVREKRAEVYGLFSVPKANDGKMHKLINALYLSDSKPQPEEPKVATSAPPATPEDPEALSDEDEDFEVEELVMGVLDKI